MTIKYHSTFKKHYKKRIVPNQKLQKRFTQRVRLFTKDKNSPLLRNHPLSGDLEGYYSFSITGDVRIVYRYESKDTIKFIDKLL